MDREKTVIKREELYEQVWARPVRQVAKSYGISDSGLAKICRRLKVPRPGRGYWAKKAHGKPTRQDPLPSLRPGDPAEFVRHPDPPRTPVVLASETGGLVAAEKRKDAEIHVAETLERPHRLVVQARAALRTAEEGSDGMLMPRRYDRLEIRVSRENLDRALRIMDALIKALRERKIDVWIADERGHPTIVRVSDEDLRISLVERFRRRERRLTPQQRRQQERGVWYGQRYDFSPSGTLSLRVHREGDYRSIRRRINDGKKKKLEHRLNEFIAILLASVDEVKEERREEETRRKEAEEYRRREEEERRRRWAEQEKRDELEREAAAWNKSEGIRAYVEALRAALPPAAVDNAPGGAVVDWLDWAEGYARAIDPRPRRLRVLRSCAGSEPVSDA